MAEKVEIIILAKDKASGVLKGINQSFGGLQSAIGTAMKVGVAGVAALGVGMAKLATDAAPLEGIQGAFEGIAEASGRSADEMLAALKKGSAGMVSQRELMMTYNSAAQLVGTTFANQLPDAMGYLGKVSAATGEDMGFMLDSLVKGVGRLSPMILDNLGIQVSLAEATERGAEMFGVAASELTKEQQQAGMMNVVMEKLAANTASMPDVAGSAAAGFAQLQATFADLKDQIGLKLLPAFIPLVSKITDLVSEYGPQLISVIGILVDKFVEFVPQVIGLVEALATGQETGIGFIDTLRGIIDAVAAVVGPILEAIGQFVSWKDVLIALALVVASIVIPALVSIVASAAPIIAIFAAIVAGVALLRTAWEEDWGGIQEKVQAVIGWIQENVVPIFNQVVTFVQTYWPIVRDVITQVMSAIWKVISTVLNAIRDWWKQHGDSVMTIAKFVWNSIKTSIASTIKVIATIITIVATAIKVFWDKWGADLMKLAQLAWDSIKVIVKAAMDIIGFIIDAVAALIRGDWEAFGEALKNIWDTTWEAIKTLVRNALKALTTIISSLMNSVKDAITGPLESAKERAGELAQQLKDAIIEKVQPIVDVFNRIKGAISGAIDKIKDLMDKLGNLELPDWMTPGSPTPLELGLRGIADAMADINATMAESPFARPVGGGARFEAGAGGGETHYHLHINTSASTEPIVDDFEMMRAWAGA